MKAIVGVHSYVGFDGTLQRYVSLTTEAGEEFRITSFVSSLMARVSSNQTIRIRVEVDSNIPGKIEKRDALNLRVRTISKKLATYPNRTTFGVQEKTMSRETYIKTCLEAESEMLALEAELTEYFANILK